MTSLVNGDGEPSISDDDAGITVVARHVLAVLNGAMRGALNDGRLCVGDVKSTLVLRGGVRLLSCATREQWETELDEVLR